MNAVAAILLSIFILSLPRITFAQGSLTPPGAPAPTMKSLDQIEARTPIDATHTPGDSNFQFIISQPGSYYLTGNITGVAGKSGIAIEANDVTIDLSGFGLVGASTSQRAIFAPSAVNNISIKNGSFRGWGAVGAVVSIANANNSIVQNLRVADALSSASGGIFVGTGCVVEDCVVSNFSSASSTGIVLGSSSTATRCSVQSCNVGISTNTSACVIKDCVVRNNGTGIQAGGSVVTHCSAYNNTGDGIQATGSCLVTDCNASYNATNHTAGTAGIHITNDSNRIDGNVATHNQNDGILADTSPTKATNNLVIRNFSAQNTNYQFRVPGISNGGSDGNCCTGDNAVAPFVTNSGINSATNPFANLTN